MTRTYEPPEALCSAVHGVTRTGDGAGPRRETRCLSAFASLGRSRASRARPDRYWCRPHRGSHAGTRPRIARDDWRVIVPVDGGSLPFTARTTSTDGSRARFVNSPVSRRNDSSWMTVLFCTRCDHTTTPKGHLALSRGRPTRRTTDADRSRPGEDDLTGNVGTATMIGGGPNDHEPRRCHRPQRREDPHLAG